MPFAGAFIGASLQSRTQTSAGPPRGTWPSSLRLSREAIPLQGVPFWGPFLGLLVAAHRRFLASSSAWVASLEAAQSLLFVDDLLCALVRDSAPDMFALVVLFFCAIAAPIS